MDVNGNRERVGHVGDLPCVSCDVLTALAAAPSGGSHQSAHAVLQRESRPVQFGLGQKLEGPGGGDGNEVVQFLGGRGLVETAHGKQMVHLHAAGCDVSTNPAELRMLGVELLEFVPQAVKFHVAEFGFSEVVVEVGMVCNLLCEDGDASLSGIGG